MRTEKPIHYLQYDSRWGDIMFSNHGDPKQTITSPGCGATSSAMVLATFKDSNITPLGVAKIIVDNGYRTYDNGVDWSWFPFMAQHYGLSMKQTASIDEVTEALRNNSLVVASMGPGYFTTFGHYIMLWGLDEVNGQILVNDPNSTVRIKASYDIFRQQAAQYFIFNAPQPVRDPFPDVPGDKWSASYIQRCKDAGWMIGDSDGLFHPAQPLTREQMAVILVRMMDAGVIKG